MESGGAILGFFAGILAVAGLLILVLYLTKQGATRLDVTKYRTKWLTIENQLKKEENSSCLLCVLNADKLLDQAMKEKGLKGQTMGERLKSAQPIWSNRNEVWEAHKLRNRIAHETDAAVSYVDARRAMSGFKQALKDLGAI